MGKNAQRRRAAAFVRDWERRGGTGAAPSFQRSIEFERARAALDDDKAIPNRAQRRKARA